MGRDPRRWMMPMALAGGLIGRMAIGQTVPLPPALATPPPESPPPTAPPLNAGIENRIGLPIDLPTALQLAGARPLDIATAEAMVQQAIGLRIQAQALKIPNLNGGVGYYRHDGTNQNLFTGQVFQKSTNALQVGGGPTLNVGLTDAIFAPLAAKRVVSSRRADLQATRNNTLATVALAYFDVQEARGRLLGVEASLPRASLLVDFAQGLAPALIAPLEINRARANLENLLQYRELATRDWNLASARLAEVLLLDPAALLEPVETPFLLFGLCPDDPDLEQLVPIALATRPEIASRRELLAAANQLLRREKARPFLPNLVATTPGTANAGVLSAGQFFGGPNGTLAAHGNRDDFSVAAYWQLQNGGLGNIGLIKQRKAEAVAAEIDVTRTLFRVRSEVAQAAARLRTSRSRVPRAEEELRQAIESADKNFLGLRETIRPAGELLNLVVRPQEVVQAIQALNTAFQDYSSAINDTNRAQFDLFRALGEPAQAITSLRKPVVPLPSTTAPLPPPRPPELAPAAGNRAR